MAKVMTLNDGDYFQLPWGTLTFHNNEIHITSDRADAAGLSIIGPNGKISFKTPDNAEKVLIEPRVNAAGDGEIYLGCYSEARYQAEVARGNPKALDAAMIEIAVANPTQIELRVPLKPSAGIVGGSSGGRVSRFYSDDGAFCFNVQGPGSGQPDGTVVQYRIVDPAGQPLPESQWVAVALWTRSQSL